MGATPRRDCGASSEARVPLRLIFGTARLHQLRCQLRGPSATSRFAVIAKHMDALHISHCALPLSAWPKLACVVQAKRAAGCGLASLARAGTQKPRLEQHFPPSQNSHVPPLDAGVTPANEQTWRPLCERHFGEVLSSNSGKAMPELIADGVKLMVICTSSASSPQLLSTSRVCVCVCVCVCMHVCVCVCVCVCMCACVCVCVCVCACMCACV